MGDWVATVLLAALALLLVSAGIEDARTREIANWKNAAIALLAPLWWWANHLALWPDVAIQLGVALLVFGFFVGAFAIGQMGGGDVKLIGALALWFPLQSFMSTVMIMALLGGGLTMVMIAEKWVRERQGLPRPSWPAMAALLGLAATGAVLLARPGLIDQLRADPLLWLTCVMAVLCAVSVLALAVIRSARRRGIVPETPYGVAIAAAALIILREPIFNQFT